MTMRFLAALMGLGLLCTGAWAAGPTYVDLAGQATVGLEDDGIADNSKGGWSDEGANDMFIYPPLPTGAATRNGYHFKLLDPGANQGKAVVMLKGQKLKDLPEQVRIPVSSARGKYLYFVQNSVRGVGGQAKNYTAAVYTVTYADGSETAIDIHDDVELRAWWCSAWYDNSGNKSWPVWMGQNTISMKWHRFLGLWAMQWENPSPDKAITAITLRSKGLCSPAIFAITLADDDYFKGPDVKKDYVRPADVPGDFFASKLAGENRLIYAAMLKDDHVKGLRQVDVIRADLLAVTTDAGLGEIGAGPGDAIVAALAKPETFTLSSTTDGDVKGGKSPLKVGRQSYEYWNGDVGTFPQNMLYWHTYYLHLAAPLKNGQVYTLTANPISADLTRAVTITYDETRTQTPVIKVNQVAYSGQSTRRFAYLGWWAGSSGTVDYAALKNFQAIDEQNGQPALRGTLALRQAQDPLSGEDVYEMDLAALRPGTYHIMIPGLGRSATFGVGGAGVRDLFQQTQRAFLHQRCGMALDKTFTDFPRPACHEEVYESGRMVADAGYKPLPGEKIRSFRGGYHDAADFDVFTYHLRATAQVLAAYASTPDWLADDDLNIPESHNKIPDILDEAQWALVGYRQTQREDGGIFLGRGNDQDSTRDYMGAHKGARPAFGLFPPETTSSAEYAAVAAQFARLIAKYDPARAADYTASAGQALAWALANPSVGADAATNKCFLAWAAGELYVTTGKPEYHETFKKLCAEGAFANVSWKLTQYIPTFTWSYIVCGREVDETLSATLKSNLLRQADEVVKQTEIPAYRMGAGARAGGLGWGNANGGGRYADPCLRAYWLTKDHRYVDAASLNADFQLGANPLSKTFITGMGARPPQHPEISELLYAQPNRRGATVKGITVYGIADAKVGGFPQEIPVWRRWRDLGNGGAEISSEFTITETIGASAMLYAALQALAREPAPALKTK